MRCWKTELTLVTKTVRENFFEIYTFSATESSTFRIDCRHRLYSFTLTTVYRSTWDTQYERHTISVSVGRSTRSGSISASRSTALDNYDVLECLDV